MYVLRSEGLGQLVSEREMRWCSYVRAIAARKPESLTMLYDEAASSLLGLAVKMMKNQADAEEILLDVFEQVWRTAPSFDPSRGSVWRWLTVLVRSRAVDRMRTAAAKRDSSRLSLDEDWNLVSREPLPDRTTILNQERVLVHKALRRLPSEQRQALELAYFSGLTHVEIASELGLPLGTVKTRIRAAIDKLRDSLSEGGLGAAASITQ